MTKISKILLLIPLVNALAIVRILFVYSVYFLPSQQDCTLNTPVRQCRTVPYATRHSIQQAYVYSVVFQCRNLPAHTIVLPFIHLLYFSLFSLFIRIHIIHLFNSSLCCCHCSSLVYKIYPIENQQQLTKYIGCRYHK